MSELTSVSKGKEGPKRPTSGSLPTGAERRTSQARSQIRCNCILRDREHTTREP
jgi:hypothetical protein